MSHDMKVVPQSNLEDNIIYLIIVREGATRLDIMNIFMKVSNGSHITNPHVEILPVLAYRLHPKNNLENGNITVDGEAISYEPLQVSITKGGNLIY